MPITASLKFEQNYPFIHILQAEYIWKIVFVENCLFSKWATNDQISVRNSSKKKIFSASGI